MCNVQFTTHAVERICDRLSDVVSYGEVQQRLSELQLIPGEHRILIKTLPHLVVIKDETAFDHMVKGNKVFALCHSTRDGIRVDTIALST